MNAADESQLFRMPDNHSSEAPVSLDDSQTTKALNYFLEVQSALNFVRDEVENKSLRVSTRFNALGTAKRILADLGALLGDAEDIQQEADLKKCQLRVANQEIRRLRAEMGKGATTEAIGHKLHELSHIVYEWWKSLGFLLAEGKFMGGFGSSYYDARLVTLTDIHGKYDFGKEDETAKKVREGTRHLLEKQIDFHIIGSDKYVLDTPKSRECLVEILSCRFPDIRINKWQSMTRGDDNYRQIIRELEVLIPITSIER